MRELGKFLAAIGTLTALGGCAAPSVPAGYTGPTATIRDSVVPDGPTKADFFYVASIDGRTIEESRGRTLVANAGHASGMDPVVVERRVPAYSIQLEIVGRTQHASPIVSAATKEYRVNGVIRFTPEPDKTYRVRGTLGERYSGVWLEDEASGAVVSEKVEVNGSAALNLLER
jgi:hypothetical protein